MCLHYVIGNGHSIIRSKYLTWGEPSIFRIIIRKCFLIILITNKFIKFEWLFHLTNLKVQIIIEEPGLQKQPCQGQYNLSQMNSRSKTLLVVFINLFIIYKIEYNQQLIRMKSQSEDNLYNYLDRQHNLSGLQHLPITQTHEQILQFIIDKDKTINNLSEDLTKLRCQNIKLNKSIKQLQDKISMNSGNNNNTGSKFMLASEFKNSFDNFMKQTISSTFCNLLGKPGLYARIFNSLMSQIYSYTQNEINKIILDLCKILKLESDNYSSKIFASILKILQDNNQIIFLLDPEAIIKNLPQLQKEEVNQLTTSQDFGQMINQLFRLVIFMLLQENKWQFILPKNKIQQFSKKQYTCIDGFIKDKEKVIVLLEGLIKQKDGFQHPNIKNYVIPVGDGDGQDNSDIDRLSGSVCLYKDKLKEQMVQARKQQLIEIEQKKAETVNDKALQRIDQIIQIPDSKTIKKQIQKIQLKNQQNIIAALPLVQSQIFANSDQIKIQQQQPKQKISKSESAQHISQLKQSIDNKKYSSNPKVTHNKDIVLHQKIVLVQSATSNKDILHQSDTQKRLKSFIQEEYRNKKAQPIVDCRKKKAGVGKIAGLLTDPNFSEMLIFPKQRKQKILTLEDEIVENRIINKQYLKCKKITFVDDLRTRKESENISQPKKSVGKIINQSAKLNTSQNKDTIHHNKQNQNHNHNINTLKEAVYKQIIKNKFKEQRSLLKLRQSDKKLIIYDSFVSKTQRIKESQDLKRRKDENYPLRPNQEHMHRFRQKNNLI